MSKETELLGEILKAVKETNRLIIEMNEAVSTIMKRVLPGKQPAETIQKGGSVTEITVYSVEKFEEWKAFFENEGIKVEFYEPYNFDENYFAKLWGYFEEPKQQKERKR